MRAVLNFVRERECVVVSSEGTRCAVGRRMSGRFCIIILTNGLSRSSYWQVKKYHRNAGNAMAYRGNTTDSLGGQHSLSSGFLRRGTWNRGLSAAILDTLKSRREAEKTVSCFALVLGDDHLLCSVLYWIPAFRRSSKSVFSACSAGDRPAEASQFSKSLTRTLCST
jgi:hypothetical protein